MRSFRRLSGSPGPGFTPKGELKCNPPGGDLWLMSRCKLELP